MHDETGPQQPQRGRELAAAAGPGSGGVGRAARAGGRRQAAGGGGPWAWQRQPSWASPSSSRLPPSWRRAAGCSREQTSRMGSGRGEAWGGHRSVGCRHGLGTPAGRLQGRPEPSPGRLGRRLRRWEACWPRHPEQQRRGRAGTHLLGGGLLLLHKAGRRGGAAAGEPKAALDGKATRAGRAGRGRRQGHRKQGCSQR